MAETQEHRTWDSDLDPRTIPIAELLFSLGWESPGDAQLERLDGALSEIEMALVRPTAERVVTNREAAANSDLPCLHRDCPCCDPWSKRVRDLRTGQTVERAYKEGHWAGGGFGQTADEAWEGSEARRRTLDATPPAPEPED